MHEGKIMISSPVHLNRMAGHKVLFTGGSGSRDLLVSMFKDSGTVSQS